MNDSLKNVLWVERYRPSTIDDCILPQHIKTNFQQFVEKGVMPNLLLSGTAGVGKTTIAKAVCNQMGYEYIIINASDEGRLIDTLRNKIKSFASSVSFSGARKVVIMDEADALPQDTVQPAFRNFIEEFSGNCGFIFTCNFKNKIIDPLQSRLCSIDFKIDQDDYKECYISAVKRIFTILNQESIPFEKESVAKIVKNNFPDLRKTINEVQRLSVFGKIDNEAIASVNAETDHFVNALRAKDFKELRRLVGTTGGIDVPMMCRKLYDAMYDVVKPNSIPQLVLILADYQYKSSFSADLEICMMAMFVEIMSSVEFV